MSLRAYNNRRDANEADLVTALRKGGCMIQLTDRPTDGLTFYRGKISLIEFKTQKGKLTASQAAFSQTWTNVVIRTLEDGLRFLSDEK